MQDLNSAGFLQTERQTIMKAVVDAESLLYMYNVQHRDLFSRNILVLGSPGLSSQLIVIINFEKSVIRRSCFPEILEEE